MVPVERDHLAVPPTIHDSLPMTVDVTHRDGAAGGWFIQGRRAWRLNTAQSDDPGRYHAIATHDIRVSDVTM